MPNELVLFRALHVKKNKQKNEKTVEMQMRIRCYIVAICTEIKIPVVYDVTARQSKTIWAWQGIRTSRNTENSQYKYLGVMTWVSISYRLSTAKIKNVSLLQKATQRGKHNATLAHSTAGSNKPNIVLTGHGCVGSHFATGPVLLLAQYWSLAIRIVTRFW